jgi:hypothetical protein
MPAGVLVESYGHGCVGRGGSQWSLVESNGTNQNSAQIMAVSHQLSSQLFLETLPVSEYSPGLCVVS